MAKLTVTPETGFVPPSVTRTTTGDPRSVLIAPLWLSPEKAAIVVADPAVALAWNVTGLPVSPLTVACTLYAPTLFPSVS
jgi:hypothetical protein